MKTILLIDDDEAICEIYGLALRHSGHDVLIAGSGQTGLALARAHRPDLILCDINMPGMDGLSVLQNLRGDAELGATQVVLMTGNRRDLSPRAGMELGADDFLLKPFTVDELNRCVAARLQRAQLDRRVEDKVVAGLRSTLQTTLPHELLTPLTGIMGLTELLLDEHQQLPAAELRQMLVDIDKAGKRLHRTLKNYFTILDLPEGDRSAAVPADRLSPENVRAAVLLGVETASQRHERTADVSVTVAECALRGTAQAVATITEELVDNACGFSPPGTPVYVQLDEAGRLTVEDQGRGMTARQIEQVGAFHQFERKKYEQQGLGLGLVLTQRLLAQCGGRLQITSSPGRSTTVTAVFASA